MGLDKGGSVPVGEHLAQFLHMRPSADTESNMPLIKVIKRSREHVVHVAKGASR